ncbi:hypothetical protein RMSM_02367 [Rhodopirellula maiorica SM1]|uniref:Uncharacterized protein n=1 Tax=Rhodopirellula maiorica SM1 TaxID=1265738 RepID=M5RNB9_9BACT|nr:hypothetical protein RMSM_02367 [Rhodopirellula maiorica SM1]
MGNAGGTGMIFGYGRPDRTDVGQSRRFRRLFDVIGSKFCFLSLIIRRIAAASKTPV